MPGTLSKCLACDLKKKKKKTSKELLYGVESILIL